MAKQKKQLEVGDKIISIVSHDEEDYISLTDMMRSEDNSFFISDWLRNKNTLEYISEWEKIHNPDFNYGEFAIITNRAGTNSFKISVKDLQKANIKCIVSKAGRYGGTYAHKDIAFQFGMWISPTFQLYLVKEYQRLKDLEHNQYNLEWDVKRLLSKANYAIHTKAIEEHIIPKTTKPKGKEWLEYAEEADLLNVAVFGCTAKEWREANPQKAKNNNIRDFASINELLVLSNMEVLNGSMIEKNIEKSARFIELKKIASHHLKELNKNSAVRAIKKLNNTVYLDNKDEEK